MLNGKLSNRVLDVDLNLLPVNPSAEPSSFRFSRLSFSVEPSLLGALLSFLDLRGSLFVSYIGTGTTLLVELLFVGSLLRMQSAIWSIIRIPSTLARVLYLFGVRRGPF